MSRTGLALGLGYAVIAVWCIAFALSSGDAKGQFVLLRAPIALQGAFVEALGLVGTVLQGLSWPAAHAVLALPTVVLPYSGGRLMGSVVSSNQSFRRTASADR